MLYAIFLNSWWFKGVKNDIPKYSIHKYRNTDTNTIKNTQIQLVAKFQKYPTLEV